MEMSAEDRERISRAIQAAEAKTSGEIVCVLAQVSSDATALPVFLAAAAALTLPWLLMATTALTVQQILSLQILTFAVLAILLCLPRVRVALIPHKLRRRLAHRMAMEQFVTRGIARKSEHSGILIFVSLAEHYARIVADDGIAARVTQRDWQIAVDALISHMREGRIADGFIEAIKLCGNELARHFPRTETSRDELPDKIYFI
ncbi:MAG: TPM domain-containing protein [Xanthobacteraceae bacterium]